MSNGQSKLMHLMGFNIYCPSQHSYTAWRDSRNTPPGFEWNRARVWQHMARELERGRFDAIFLADQLAAFKTHRGNSDSALESGVMFPVHDPMVLMPMLAAVTDRVGLAVTLSTTYNPPYLSVRKMGTLDHLSEGRAGWNIVTSFHTGEADNIGVELVSHDQRYVQANEFMEVCFKLWNSWEPGAIVRDVDKPMLVDPKKVHAINHVGKFYKSLGFACHEPSPQHHPVLFQAGSSGPGRDFCARWAEAAFAIMLDGAQMRAFVDDMADRVERQGRPASSVKCMFCVQPIVGESEAEALEKQQWFHELGTVDAALCALSSHTGFDFSTLDPSAPVSSVPELPGIQGMFKALVEFAGSRGGPELTIGEAVRHYARSSLAPQIVGTGAQVAEQLIALWEESGGHGFMTTPIFYPGAYTEFVDLVVPELQKCGVFRKEYTGRTLREHLAQESVE